MALSKELLIDLYDSEGSVSGVARALGVSRKVVANAMKNLGVEYSSTYRKYSINDQFFSQSLEDENQFYWAGFLASSANIVVADSYRIELNVALIDKPYLQKMVHDMDGNVPVRTAVVFLRGERYYEARTVISSKQLVHDLARFNVVPKKKRTYTMPSWLMQHRLLRHFLRGWFDGRGGFYKEKEEFRTSGTQMFLEQVINCLTKHARVEKDHCTILPHDQDIHWLRVYTSSEVGKIAKYLYHDATRYRDNRFETFGVYTQEMVML